MADTPETGDVKVFISYSRQDMALVDRLQTALSSRGIKTFVDRNDIEKGEAWWARISQLITEADTIVFVLSPSSVDSQVCADEIAFAERLNKRLIPIVVRDLNGRNVPLALARLNYIWFIENVSTNASGDFEPACNDLVRALENNLPWIREHTRLGSLAERWQARKRPADLLLRGAELAAAETWLTTRPNKAPDPTDAHRALITLSRQATAQRQRTLVGMLLAGVVVATALAGIAIWQRGLAVAGGERALKSQHVAETTLREAQITQSGLASETVRELLKLPGAGGAPLAMLLALEGMPDLKSEDGRQRGRPNVAEMQFQLDQAYFDNRERVAVSHDDGVRTLAWSPDGSRLATGSGWANAKTGAARIIDAATGKELLRLPSGHIVWTVAWSPDGKRLATGSDDRMSRIFDAATGNELLQMKHDNIVWDVKWSPDGTRLATSSARVDGASSTTRVFDATSGQALVRINHEPIRGMFGGRPRSAWNLDGTRLAIGSTNNVVLIVDAVTGNELVRLAHDAMVRTFAWSPNGQRLATGALDNTARIVDAATGAELARVRHDNTVVAIAWSPDGTKLATGSRDKLARVVDATTGKELVQVVHGDAVTLVQWDPKGTRLATGSNDNTARVIDTATGAELARVVHGEKVEVVAWSIDGTRLATSSLRDATLITEVSSGKEAARFDHAREVRAVAWSPDGRRLGTGSDDNSARIVDAATGAVLTRVQHHNAVKALAWSPDGAKFATGSVDDTARIVDAATGRELVRVLHSGAVHALSWSPDGTRLATGSSDNTARLIDAATGKEFARVVHKDSVLGVAWSPDGARIATVSLDNSAKIVEAASGLELMHFTCEHMRSNTALNPEYARPLDTCALGNGYQRSIMGEQLEICDSAAPAVSAKVDAG